MERNRFFGLKVLVSEFHPPLVENALRVTNISIVDSEQTNLSRQTVIAPGPAKHGIPNWKFVSIALHNSSTR